MKLTIPVKDLSQALATAVLAVEKKSTIPVLSNVKLEAKGGKLYLDASDLERWISLSIPCNVEKEGSITVPAKRMADYFNLLPHADATLESTPAMKLTVKCVKSRTALPGMSVENFPERPRFNEKDVKRYTIPGSWLSQIQSRVGFAIANEESRYTLIAALIEFKGALLIATSTDGHRLSQTKFKNGVPFDEQGKSLVPKASLDIAARLFGSAESASIAFETNHVVIEANGYTLITRKLSGNFPDYERVLPSKAPHVVEIKREELMASLARVTKFADAMQAVKMAINGDLKLSAANNGGDAEETVTYSGEASGMFGIKSTYVHDFLRAVGCADVQMRFTDHESAIEFREGGGDDSYRYVVMPMRV